MFLKNKNFFRSYLQIARDDMNSKAYVSTRWVKTDYGMKKVDRLNRYDLNTALDDVEEDYTKNERAQGWVENSRIADLEKEISEIRECEKRLRKQRDMFYRRILNSMKNDTTIDPEDLLKDYEEAYDLQCSQIQPVDALGKDYKIQMMKIKFKI